MITILSYLSVSYQTIEEIKGIFTKDLKWRVDQLKSLLRMYEENEGLIVEALKKDLHKSKWETGKLLAKLSSVNSKLLLTSLK